MATYAMDLVSGVSGVIQRKLGMSREEFVEEHLRASVPVVIGDASAAWAARRMFTPEWFSERFGERTVEAGGKSYTLRALLDVLRDSSPERPAPYPCHYDMLALFPELASFVDPRPEYAKPDRTDHPLLPRRLLGCANTLEIFFGGPGGQFPYLHYDYMGLHAFVAQLYGRKEFTVIAPAFAGCVYPDPDNPWRSLMEDHHAPDYARYPLFEGVERLTFRVEPGDTLFIPNGWWHTARSLDLTISVAYDLLNDSNWDRFRGEVRAMLQRTHPAKRVAADLYLRMLGSTLSLEEELAAGVRGRPERAGGVSLLGALRRSLPPTG